MSIGKEGPKPAIASIAIVGGSFLSPTLGSLWWWSGWRSRSS